MTLKYAKGNKEHRIASKRGKEKNRNGEDCVPVIVVFCLLGIFLIYYFANALSPIPCGSSSLSLIPPGDRQILQCDSASPVFPRDIRGGIQTRFGTGREKGTRNGRGVGKKEHRRKNVQGIAGMDVQFPLPGGSDCNSRRLGLWASVHVSRRGPISVKIFFCLVHFIRH